MRILFVTPYVPSVVRVRPFAFIRELAAQGHQVTLACLVQPASEASYLSEVQPYCTQVYPVFLEKLSIAHHLLSSLPGREPLSVAYCRSAEFDRLVKDLAEKGDYDLVHTEFVRAAPATLKLTGYPRIFDAVDSLTLAYRRSMQAAMVPAKQRMVSIIEWLKMRSYEPWVFKQYERVLVSSPIDRSVMAQSTRPVEVIPNGVDVDYFAYDPRPSSSHTLVFVGKMSYYVNVASVLWFYHEVLPRIRRECPDVCFQIVGRNPVKAVRQLAADPGVVVTGTVEDIRPYLAQAAIAVCPMVSGSGIQNKVLEAMAVGTPCVITSLAVQALQAKDGEEVSVADSPEGFAASVLELLEQPERRANLSEMGREYVNRHHRWSQIGLQLEECYKDLFVRN